jgi:chromosomal replication initiator protein
LVERYSFDNFIEGDCNRLARSAGLAIGNNPGKTAFNPLFIYSKVVNLSLIIALGYNEQKRDNLNLFTKYVDS